MSLASSKGVRHIRIRYERKDRRFYYDKKSYESLSNFVDSVTGILHLKAPYKATRSQDSKAAYWMALPGDDKE